jgi:hypothetical protein
LRDAIATDVMRDLSEDTVKTTLRALRDIKDRIKAMSDDGNRIAAK